MDNTQNGTTMSNAAPPTATVAPLWAVGVPDRPLEWFYPNVFVQGELNGVQGIPGDGKTWLMCELAAQTSIGGVVQGTLDANDVTELPLGNVLYLSGDDAPERLKERLVSRGADLSKVAFAPDGTLPQIGSPELEQLFVQTRPTLCMDTPESSDGSYDAVIKGVDTTMAYIGAYSTSTASASEALKGRWATAGGGTDCTGTTITGCTGGYYYVRYVAVDTGYPATSAFRSNSTEVQIATSTYTLTITTAIVSLTPLTYGYSDASASDAAIAIKSTGSMGTRIKNLYS